MFSNLQVKDQANKTMQTPEFKQYLKKSKTDEDYRLHDLVHFNLTNPNTFETTSYELMASQDFKQVRVIEQGVYDTEWGYLPIPNQNKAKKSVKTTKSKASKAKAKARSTKTVSKSKAQAKNKSSN